MESHTNSYDEEIKGLVYDLRQTYARILGDNLARLDIAKQQKNYPEQYEILDNIHTITFFKWEQEKEKLDKKEKDKIKDEKNKIPEYEKTDPVYDKISGEVITLANEHLSEWSGNSTDQVKIAQIRLALKKLEMYVLYKMNEAKLFGSKYLEDMDAI